MRYFLELAYKGTNYHGWQIQPNAISVQEVINDRLSKLLREEINIVGAGRTDTGVHAKQMYAHFDTDREVDTQHLCHKLNSFLPKDISIRKVHRVVDDAHARFGASSRKYEYYLKIHKDPFSSEGAFYYRFAVKPDMELMNEAAKIMMEYEDFECFSRAHSDVKTFICKITQAEWRREDGDTLVFHIRADRFLRNMVRAVVGTLIEVGIGKLSLEDFRAVLESKNRSEAGTSAEAQGLYLVEVNYPKEIFDV